MADWLSDWFRSWLIPEKDFIMDYGNLTTSQQEQYKRNATARSKQPSLAIWIEGLGDVSDYVKSYYFDRQIENAIREKTPSTGHVVISDIDGMFAENGHPKVKANASVIINAGYGDVQLPRFSGIVNNPRIDTSRKEIDIEIADYAQVLDEKQAEGFYSDYPTPKTLIERLVSNIQPNLSIEYENATGEVATYEFGSLGASFASACSAGAGATMTDTTKNFATLEVGMAIQNTTDGSFGVITTITSTAPATTPNDTLVCSEGLHGGTANTWTALDGYQVYDKIYFDPRSYWSIVKGALYCIGQLAYFDEKGVLQIQRRSSFTDTDIIFYDRDIISLDYLDMAKMVNVKAINYKNKVRYTDWLDGINVVGQKHRRGSNLASIEQYKEYADYLEEDLVNDWGSAERVINEELAYSSYPRYMQILEVTARPELQLFDRIQVSSDERNIYGKFIIIGISEDYQAGRFINKFTLLSPQERF